MTAIRLLSPYASAAYGPGAAALYWRPANDDSPIALDTLVNSDDWRTMTLEEWLDENDADRFPYWRARVLRDLAETGASRGGECGELESWYVWVAPEGDDDNACN
jgi:hypothetical protein